MYLIYNMLFGKRSSIGRFFRKEARGAKRVFSKVKKGVSKAAGAVAGVGEKVDKVAGKFIDPIVSSPLTDVAVGVLAPEALPFYEGGKAIYQEGRAGQKIATRVARGIQQATKEDEPKKVIEKEKPKKLTHLEEKALKKGTRTFL